MQRPPFASVAAGEPDRAVVVGALAMLETCTMSKSSRAVGSFALDCTGSRATVKLGRRIGGGFIQEIFREQPDHHHRDWRLLKAMHLRSIAHSGTSDILLYYI